MIANGTFREDLYYRLNVVPIHLPPLRERKGDVRPLTQHFLRQAAEEGLPQRRLSGEAAALMEAHSWRGNVRELRNFVFRAALLSREEEIDAATVRQMLAERGSQEPARDGGLDKALLAWLGDEAPPAGTL